jgi:hypothetical protein
VTIEITDIIVFWKYEDREAEVNFGCVALAAAFFLGTFLGQHPEGATKLKRYEKPSKEL